MFVLSNLLIALANILNIIFTIIYWLIIIRAIISWVSPDPYNPIVQFLYRTTDPILEPIRRLLPMGMRFSAIDFSPLIAILLIIFLKSFLVRTLIDIAYRYN